MVSDGERAARCESNDIEPPPVTSPRSWQLRRPGTEGKKLAVGPVKGLPEMEPDNEAASSVGATHFFTEHRMAGRGKATAGCQAMSGGALKDQKRLPGEHTRHSSIPPCNSWELRNL